MPGKFIYEPEVSIHKCDKPKFEGSLIKDELTDRRHQIVTPRAGAIWECVCGRQYKAVKSRSPYWDDDYRAYSWQEIEKPKPKEKKKWSWQRER